LLLNGVLEIYRENGAMRVFLVPTSKMYLTGAFLCNVHNCLYPNHISQYFDLEPPSLEEYVQLSGV
jgi:hypothetical protein